MADSQVKVSKTRTPPTQTSARDATRVIKAADESDSDIEIISGPTPTRPVPKSKSKTKLQPLYDDDSETSDTSSSTDSTAATAPICDVPNKYAKYWTPPAATAGTPTARQVATPSRASGSKLPKKLSEAALLKREAQERATHLAQYAEQVYSYLNRKIFKNQLPSLGNMEIKWNSRLLTTAGRAHFHRDKEGHEFTEIHLATKVVDCEERIRNTLSHEMCHLACWIIDNKINESHGKIFHKWAAKVEEKCVEITISTEHTYEISYNFEWECAKCEHIVGRYTNSLDPTVTKCPSCKTGTLSPLFDPKLPKNGALSRSASWPQPSPRARLVVPVPAQVPHLYRQQRRRRRRRGAPRLCPVQKEIYVVHDSDSETEDQSITELARKFEGITIAHKTCLHARAKRTTRVRDEVKA
ncbi:SprT-like family-domain-containing protein [Mycena galopus ATCC 62051]|nr:SprT-like family-domain-containing protein [Mycena galopus ATCC 62051]